MLVLLKLALLKVSFIKVSIILVLKSTLAPHTTPRMQEIFRLLLRMANC